MKKIYLDSDDLKIVEEILKDYKDVYVFGSRATGKHKKFSDLDLFFKQSIPDYEEQLLKEKFEKSNLPFTVDIVFYDKVSDYLKNAIDKEAIKLK
ncbi:nucleotidyltransferase domain-containing protein [Candidatus Babeliales bacterium]|nr:nucleotidyltransferase domain-containing protein [Candidatus Babeliales bacterium]MCF7899717.1 nucleotidyltransferase domain-containing protein [Candidatus Babeliales bacterium]